MNRVEKTWKNLTFMWPCIVIWRSCDQASWYDVHVTMHRNMTFMWPCIVIWRSCDHAPWYDVHVTMHRGMTFMWPCIVIWRSCDHASWYDVHVTMHRDMKFMWPCIVIWRSCDHASWYDVHVTRHRVKFLIRKPTRCINFSNLFLELNSPDSSSVLHQEFFTVHTAVVYVILVSWQLASRIRMELSSILILLLSDIYHCCAYSAKLLMTDRGTVRNM